MIFVRIPESLPTTDLTRKDRGTSQPWCDQMCSLPAPAPRFISLFEARSDPKSLKSPARRL